MAAVRPIGGGAHGSASSRFPVVSSLELFQPLPPVRWLVPSLLLAPGAPTLFAGYGYSGKSVALQSLALSVASGRPLWGEYSVRQGRVLHLDYEQGRRITAGRYQRLAYAEAIDPEEIADRLEACILPSSGLDLETLVQLGDGRDLVLVDSWRAAHPNVDENSSDVRRTLDAMGLASERTGAVFVVLHHARKPQGEKGGGGGGKHVIRGSSGFFDGCQTIYLFDGAESGRPLVSLEKDRVSGSKLEPFRLVIEDDEGRSGLRVRVEAEDANRTRTGAWQVLCASIVEHVGKNPGQSASAAWAILGGKKEHFLAAVQTLLADGKLSRQGNGHTSKLFLGPK